MRSWNVNETRLRALAAVLRFAGIAALCPVGCAPRLLEVERELDGGLGGANREEASPDRDATASSSHEIDGVELDSAVARGLGPSMRLDPSIRVVALYGEVLERRVLPAYWPIEVYLGHGSYDVELRRVRVGAVRLGGVAEGDMIEIFDIGPDCGGTGIVCDGSREAEGVEEGHTGFFVIGYRPEAEGHPASGLPFTIRFYRRLSEDGSFALRHWSGEVRVAQADLEAAVVKTWRAYSR